MIDFPGSGGETLEVDCIRLEIEPSKKIKHFRKLMKQKYFYYPASFLFCHYELFSPVKKILFPRREK